MPFPITWDAPEFEYREKDVSWYWITIIVAAIVVAFSVWQRNFLFGLFIVIAEMLLILWGNRKPEMIVFTLTESEITIGQHKVHSLKEFESWSAAEIGDGWSDMAFNFKTKVKTPLKILASDVTVEEIRNSLKPILKEIEHQDSFIDTIEKWVRF